MKKTINFKNLAKAIFLILLFCLLLAIMIPILKYWKQEQDAREKNCIRTIFSKSQEYLDDSFGKGEVKTSLTCEDLVKADYIVRTPREAIGVDVEIKVTQKDGRPSVEYVKSKRFIYSGEGEFF